MPYHHIQRRRLLQVGALGVSGLALPSLLRADVDAPPPRAKACILLYMDGGPSHIDLWDMKPQAPAEIRGPYRSIGTSQSGLQIGELLPHMAQQMHRVTLVRSLRHTETVHDPAVYQMLTGYKHVSSAGGLKVEETDLPQMGAALGYADRRPAVMPKAIQLPETMKMQSRVLPGQSAGFLGTTHDPFPVEVTPAGEVLRPELSLQQGISIDRFGAWQTLLSQFNRELGGLRQSAELSQFDVYQRQAVEILAAPSMQAAFDLELESPATRERYGLYRHGQATLLARRLVESGARFVTVYWGHEDQDWADGKGARPANNPWDTHRNHFPLLKDSLAPRADRTLAALIEDLDQRGLLDETLVVWMGDFGRTPRISKQFTSRDHWPHAFSIVMAGGGVPRGQVLGATDRTAADVIDRPISPADLTATIYSVLGVDARQVMPGPQGKRYALSTGRAVPELLG